MQCWLRGKERKRLPDQNADHVFPYKPRVRDRRDAVHRDYHIVTTRLACIPDLAHQRYCRVVEPETLQISNRGAAKLEVTNAVREQVSLLLLEEPGS